jgi:hypothetical protein
MGATRPPAVHDPRRRTKVLDWKVPLRVGAGSGAVTGALTWVGRPDDGFPVAAVIALGAVAVGGLGLVVVVRRRRRRGDGGQRDSDESAEAW